jgi:chemotaxis protein methyltransferase CheR
LLDVLTTETEACEFIIGLIYSRCRIRLHQGKVHLIKARLGKRLRRHGFDTLLQYTNFLKLSADEGEITAAVDALTTNFTQFLREEEHFRCMVQEALPELIAPGRKRFSVWSAACATGEEPYSVAFYLAEHYPLEQGWDWRIFASDVSTRALDTAKAAIYPANKVEPFSAEQLRRNFQRGVRDWEGHYRVKPHLAAKVAFSQINLLGSYTLPSPFEIIFCRNVMIYFDRPTQEQLVRQLSSALVPGGFLFIGHSESLNALDVPFTCLRPSIYRKQ